MSYITTDSVNTEKEIHFYLVNGIKLVGKVSHYDMDADGRLIFVAITTPNKVEVMEIMGHAIATIVDPNKA